MSVNRVTLVGRVGKDPEVRYTGGGQAVANFSLATDESYKNREGEKVKKTEWHRIVIWGKLAEIVEQYVTKGSLLYLEGRIESKEWEDREGLKRKDKDIICDKLRMLGGGEEKSEEPQERPKAKAAAKPTAKTAPKKRQPQSEAEEEQYQPTSEDVPF